MEGPGVKKKILSAVTITRLRNRKSRPMLRRCNNCKLSYAIPDVNNNLVVYLICPYCLYKRASVK